MKHVTLRCICKSFRLTILICLNSVNGLQLFGYSAPLVSLKERRAWIINGNFNLVHVINLDQFQHQLEEVAECIKKHFRDPDRKQLIKFHMVRISERLNMLKAKPQRGRRSIDWVGSAIKWVAGNPDAADWDRILESQQSIVNNNNHQYKVNEKLFGVIEDMTRKLNWVIDNSNKEIRVADIQKFEQDILHQVLLIKDEVNEIVRACQMAKSGIINTNLLNHDEVNMLLNEFETLPYENEIEAIEFGKPSVYANSSMLLYVLSIPKVREEIYNLLLVRPSILNGTQVNVEFNKVLINQHETYGVIRDCLSINNSTVCKEEYLERVPENHCLARLLKGGNAECTYRTNTNEIIELIQEDTIFISNFNGTISSPNSSQHVSGTFIVRLHNETVKLNNKTFTSSCLTALQALPPILTNISNLGHKINLEYVHSLSVGNIERIKELSNKTQLFALSDALIFTAVIALAYITWRKIGRKLSLPTLGPQQDEMTRIERMLI